MMQQEEQELKNSLMDEAKNFLLSSKRRKTEYCSNTSMTVAQ